MTCDSHYDLELLAELAEGLLDAATALQVREHLAICDPCGESLADLAAVREVLAATATPAMPMGVALRIDRALAAEADSFRGGGVGLVEAPAWDDMMRDAPWETTSLPQPAWKTTSSPEPEWETPSEPEPEPVVRLGVVGDDGTIVPARQRKATRRQTTRRRRWAMPAAAVGAAAAVIGAAVMTTSMLSATGTDGPPVVALPPSVDNLQYTLTDSNWNYTDGELKGPLLDYIGPVTMTEQDGMTQNSKLAQCVKAVSKKVGTSPFAVDQGFYNGQEANILVFWRDKAKNTVDVHVVGPECDNVRKPALAHWK
ncbi:Putative zinc-finger [Streptosporangium subroseum]|uniref:Putative zinc-finger n=1 Tax=Streptosporangium subroseum TaxID=106412 RepID=A0A239NZ71_9ACTN|nr:zf-HC2 domain-containing protein [Streptosporangium subroseum]SNT59718.1 Putative zinc-finger [Streptosporangium subroseum]